MLLVVKVVAAIGNRAGDKFNAQLGKQCQVHQTVFGCALNWLKIFADCGLTAIFGMDFFTNFLG